LSLSSAASGLVALKGHSLSFTVHGCSCPKAAAGAVAAAVAAAAAACTFTGR
jgi:hypothetical protein